MNKTLTIDGMSCEHCVMRVKNALEQLDGVEKVEVDLANKRADVQLNQDIDESTLTSAVQETGYSVTAVD